MRQRKAYDMIGLDDVFLPDKWHNTDNDIILGKRFHQILRLIKNSVDVRHEAHDQIRHRFQLKYLAILKLKHII